MPENEPYKPASGEGNAVQEEKASLPRVRSDAPPDEMSYCQRSIHPSMKIVVALAKE